jgi:hypothetical protein
MAIQIRKGTGSVERAVIATVNALRVWTADASAFVHRDTSSVTAGDYTTARAVPAVFASPPASDLPSLLRLCAELLSRHRYHLADAFAHKQADGVNGLANPPPDTLVTAQAFLNDAKAKWNAHLTAAGVHVNNDAQPITAPDATNLQTTVDLANTYRLVFGVHIQNALPGAFLELIDP